MLKFPVSPTPVQPPPAVSFTYPVFVDTPTDALLMGPNGFICLLNPAEVCLQADAQKVADGLASLFPGKSVTIYDASVTSGSPYYVMYRNDPRRQWVLLVDGVSPGAPKGTTDPKMWPQYVKTLMIQSYAQGVGAPGHFQYAPASGEPANDPSFEWVPDPQVVVVPVVNTPITVDQIEQLITAYNSQAGVTAVSLAK